MLLLVQFGLRFYKRIISPLLPGSCRFVPTCADYAAEALENYGVLRGGAMVLWRLLRCQPLARAGFDPVPRLHQDCNRKAPSSWRTHTATSDGAVSRLKAGC